MNSSIVELSDVQLEMIFGGSSGEEVGDKPFVNKVRAKLSNAWKGMKPTISKGFNIYSKPGQVIGEVCSSSLSENIKIISQVNIMIFVTIAQTYGIYSACKFILKKFFE